MPKQITRDDILRAGVKNLKEFGYTEVTPENIVADYVYGRFFENMLIGTLEDAPRLAPVIDPLLAEVREAPAKCPEVTGKKAK